jgi:UDP-GlcNAc:undecaprenyl-phosphate GlcNAc-1-phosphate transferase
MRTAAFSFLLSLVLSAALTPLVRELSRRRGLLDHALEARKIHGRPVPRLGGLAIVVGFFAPLLGLLLYPTGMADLLYGDPRAAAALLLGAACTALLGLYDDLRGAGAGLKLTVQVAIAAGLWWAGIRIERLGIPGLGMLELGALSLPLTALWMTGIVNAMNLIDGLDGLAGGVAFLASATSFVVAFVRGDATMSLLSAALAGSVLGFLAYNFNPASIFMGDTGSMFLGFVLAAGSVQTQQKASTLVALLVPLLALGLPVVDTAFAIARRTLSGKPIFSADREHIHHRLLAVGLTHRQAVLVLYGASVLLGGGALVLSFANSWATAGYLTALTLLGALGVRRLQGLLRQQGPAGPPAPLRGLVRELAPELLRAADLEALWCTLQPAASRLGAARLLLLLPGRDPLVAAGTAAQAAEPFAASFPLGERGALGQLELVFADGTGGLGREREVALETLSDLLTAALLRLGVG